jgi:hypothetical protein
MSPPVRTYWCPTCDECGISISYDKKISFYCVLDKQDLNKAVEKFLKFKPGEVFCDDCLGHSEFYLPFNSVGAEEYEANVYIGINLPGDLEDEIGRILIERGVFDDDQDL